MTPSHPSNPRAKITILVMNMASGYGIHFCCHEKLSGTDANLWFPVTAEAVEADLFSTVENIMLINNVAHNVTSVSLARSHPICRDFDVIYNAKA